MTKIIAVVNQKGGVGKTTTATNLSALIGKAGKKVLLIDLDPQGSTTSSITRQDLFKNTSFSWITNKQNFKDCVQKSVLENVDLLPSKFELALIELDATLLSERKEYILKEKIKEIDEKYDFIFIDCSPSLGILNINALTAANALIIPVQPEKFAMEGMTQLLSVIKYVQNNTNVKLRIEGVLITLFDKRLTIALENSIEISKSFMGSIYKNFIPKDTNVSKSQQSKKVLINFAPESEAALAYSKVAEEFLSKN